LKKERIKKQIYKNRELAIADVADYIDTFYNRTRRHSHLGGLSPSNSKRPTKRAGSVSTKSWELHSGSGGAMLSFSKPMDPGELTLSKPFPL
jgi:hypothetical protein